MAEAVRIYRGRQPGVVTVDAGGPVYPLDPRLDLRNHSPTGFQWGYLGSGPAQLALAILADALGDDRRADRCYQEFKRRVVQHWPRDWSITRARVVAQVELIEAEMMLWGRTV